MTVNELHEAARSDRKTEASIIAAGFSLLFDTKVPKGPEDLPPWWSEERKKDYLKMIQ